MRRFFSPKHPFRLLLYLEWILLGIAILAVLAPLSRPPRRLPHHRPPPPFYQEFRPFPAPQPRHSFPQPQGRHRQRFPTVLGRPPQRLQKRFPLAAIACIGTIGLLGLRLPVRSPQMTQALYTGVGLGLSCLAVLLVGHGQSTFPPLLLIVVIRACLMFPWSGRIGVAVLAYVSFLFMLILSVLRIEPLGVPLSILDRFARRQWPDLEAVLLNITLNSSLLFGLVLAFVLLLVGALLTEKRSHQELTQANQRLRRYALMIENQATLQERNRIAREMHDSVGHSLTAQSIQLENVAMWLPQNVSKATDHLQKARHLGKEALQNVRQSVAALRAHPLQGQTLPTALTQLIQAFERTTNIEVKSQINLTTSLPKDMAIALYRLIQEAFTNIAKHSQATQVQLQMMEHATDINLLITDNGQGFDPIANTTGFGLQGMRERTEALGGAFQLHSQPGQGCQIQVEIPRSGGRT